MDWQMVGVMITVACAISSLMGFVMSLMIRAAIEKATKSITDEIRRLLREDYVPLAVYERDMRELRDGMTWLEGELGKD